MRAVIQFPWPSADPLPTLQLACIAAGVTDSQLSLSQSLETSAGFAHLPLAENDRTSALQIKSFLADRLPDVSVRCVVPLLEIVGVSNGQPALYRYVVETDVHPDQEAEFNDWYNTEHLAALASVPGTVRAARYRCLDDGPQYLACYDLERLDVVNSPAWLAVRATDWSKRVRPTLQSTRRSMFRRIA
jgi:hypothetical protein